MGPRPCGEDVEDNLGPVDDLDVQMLLEVPRSCAGPRSLSKIATSASCAAASSFNSSTLPEPMWSRYRPAAASEAARRPPPSRPSRPGRGSHRGGIVGIVVAVGEENPDPDRLLAAVGTLSGFLGFDQAGCDLARGRDGAGLASASRRPVAPC